LKNANIDNRYIFNARKELIASFRPDDLAKCYHLEVGNKKLDGQALSELDLTPKYLFPTWYKADKHFKYQLKRRYPTTNLKIYYQYMVAMLCILYGEPNTTHFPLSCMPLIYLCVEVGTSFNWADILSEKLKNAISFSTQAQLGSFPNFHMDSYLLDIMCIAHKYPNMGWIWLLADVTIHIYSKVIWEHKYRTDYQRICEHFLAPLYEFIFAPPHFV
jgi:hypothetical protein